MTNVVTVAKYEFGDEAKAYLASLKAGDPVEFAGSISPNLNVFSWQTDPVAVCNAVVVYRDESFISITFPNSDVVKSCEVSRCRASDGVLTMGFIFRRIVLPGVQIGKTECYFTAGYWPAPCSPTIDDGTKE